VIILLKNQSDCILTAELTKNALLQTTFLAILPTGIG